MGRFENEGRCPDCQSLVGEFRRCRVCGLPVVGPEADQLRRLLADADRVLVELRASAVPPPKTEESGAVPTAGSGR
jgi:predicted amidophosphoribosyltransferase